MKFKCMDPKEITIFRLDNNQRYTFVHNFMLAISSDKFKALNKNRKGFIDTTLSKYPLKVSVRILAYFYSGTYLFDKDNILDTLEIVLELGIERLFNEYYKVLNPGNVCSIYSTAVDKVSVDHPQIRAMEEYIRYNFDRICQVDKVFKLNYNQLKKFLIEENETSIHRLFRDSDHLIQELEPWLAQNTKYKLEIQNIMSTKSFVWNTMVRSDNTVDEYSEMYPIEVIHFEINHKALHDTTLCESVVIELRDGSIISCSRFLLFINSDFFYILFSTKGFKEHQSGCNYIQLFDEEDDPEIIKKMITHIKFGKVSLANNIEAITLLFVSHKYGVLNTFNSVKEWLCNKRINSRNCDLIEYASELFEIEELKLNCDSFKTSNIQQ
jgi:hypothetical protein